MILRLLDAARAARFPLALALGLLLLLAPLSCSRPTASTTNVLLITVDTLRADRLGCYGYATAQTPHIDRLAAEGALFEHAYCDVPWTTPSMASVMTGTYAIHHGFRSTYQQLAESNFTLAEALKAKGYQTAAVIGSFPLDSSFRLNQGFDSYDEKFDTPSVLGEPTPGSAQVPAEFHANVDAQRLHQFAKARADAYRSDDKVSDVAIEWLKRAPRQPYFLWVHYFGPHEKSDARLSEDEARAKMLRDYDPDVATNDRAVGRLLDALRARGDADRTVVILHADHGQSLGEHFYFGHGKNLYDATLRIPLIVRAPGRIPAGRRVASLARNVDIMPTVLEVLGLPLPDGLDGRSLVPLTNGGESAPPEAEMYMETYLSATEAFGKLVRLEDNSVDRLGFVRRGVRTAQWAYVINEPSPFIDYSNPPPVPPYLAKKYRSEELYDLEKDPGERVNVIGKRPLAQIMITQKLAAYLATSRTPSAHKEMDEAAKERMRSLGYMK